MSSEEHIKLTLSITGEQGDYADEYEDFEGGLNAGEFGYTLYMFQALADAISLESSENEGFEEQVDSALDRLQSGDEEPWEVMDEFREILLETGVIERMKGEMTLASLGNDEPLYISSINKRNPIDLGLVTGPIALLAVLALLRKVEYSSREWSLQDNNGSIVGKVSYKGRGFVGDNDGSAINMKDIKEMISEFNLNNPCEEQE